MVNTRLFVWIGRKKNDLRSFFDFMSLRGTTHKRLSREASYESPAPEEVSSGLLSFGGLALERSDRQRFARGRPFGRDEVWCRGVQSVRSL